jgi:phage terminase large subunit-like protein
MPAEINAAEIYQKFRDNIDIFAAFFFPELHTLPVPDFHKEMYQLAKEHDRLILAAPRGFSKSGCLARIYPLHAALFKEQSDICIISASEGLAVEHLRWIKMQVENNLQIKAFWGNVQSDKWTENHIGIKVNGKVCNIRARGAGAQIRGFRPSCIILDDIETDESVESEDQRRKLKNWLFKACINSMTADGQFIMIGTLIHPLAILSDLFVIPNGWHKKKYRAYKTHEQVAGNELWPELWPHNKLQARKQEIGTSAFASEYLNDPLADENAPIKDENIKYWDELPKQYSAVIAIDPAYSTEESADFKTACLVGLDQNGNRYLIDYIHSHDTSLDFINDILNLYLRNKDRITAVGCPNTGGDREFWSSLLRVSGERNVYPPFVELKNTFTTASGRKIVNKHQRIIAALQPLFENCKYYIHTSHIEARDELLTFSAGSKHDDLVDCMTYAEQILSPIYFQDTEDRPVETAVKFDGYGVDW